MLGQCRDIEGRLQHGRKVGVRSAEQEASINLWRKCTFWEARRYGPVKWWRKKRKSSSAL